MYLIPIHVGASKIEGKGVFASERIPKGTIAWKYVEGHDISLSVAEHDQLDEAQKKYLEKVAYLSHTSNQYIYPPENDPALYTNHDAEAHNLSVVNDKSISPEPFFIANRDIEAGEELTNNYHEFDAAISAENSPDWLSH